MPVSWAARFLVCTSAALVAFLLGTDHVEAQPGGGATRPRPAAGVRAVAAGGHHTCAVMTSGTIACWGLNADGQLGHGEPTATPVVVPGVASAVAIAAGRGHTCVARADGIVSCWGANTHGQLGRATERERLTRTPAPVDGISTATAVSAGRDHTCALLRDGSVRCWGGNQSGQLGDGTTRDSIAPVAVPEVSEAVHIASGRFHTCAVLREGAVRCWGANDAGQLGAEAPLATPGPVTVAGLPPAATVAAGHSHTCAALRDRKVRCWGHNGSGQLGIGNSDPVTGVHEAMDVTDVVTVGAGGTQSCAVLADGTQRCWGTDGVPGVEHVTFALRTAIPLQTPGVTGAAAVAPGLAHTCILLRSGEVRCRGNNTEGQLGDGTFQNSRPPVAVAGVSRARAIASGDAHTCVLAGDGAVLCWGSSLGGQLGRPAVASSVKPVTVAGLAAAIDAVSGEAHSCALVAGGSVRCWGRNTDGQLGRGWKSQGSFRTEPVIDLPGATALAAGRAFTCALVTGGTVRCWGANASGQLGDGTTRSSTLPRIVSGVSGATAIAAGANFACAVVAGGEARCWGGTWGPEGPPRPPPGASTTLSQTLAPVPVDGLARATAVVIGENFACASRSDLTLVCWGMNDVGQLGAPEVRAAVRPIMVTGVAWPVAAVAGRFHACALRRDGKVKCWGRSDVGQLGPASVGESSAAPVRVESVVNAVGLSAGAMHTCALIEDGAVRCWGDNATGQLGQEPTVKFSHTAVLVPLPR